MKSLKQYVKHKKERRGGRKESKGTKTKEKPKKAREKPKRGKKREGARRTERAKGAKGKEGDKKQRGRRRREGRRRNLHIYKPKAMHEADAQKQRQHTKPTRTPPGTPRAQSINNMHSYNV